jgi:hypothetical protein
MRARMKALLDGKPEVTFWAFIVGLLRLMKWR